MPTIFTARIFFNETHSGRNKMATKLLLCGMFLCSFVISFNCFRVWTSQLSRIDSTLTRNRSHTGGSPAQTFLFKQSVKPSSYLLFSTVCFFFLIREIRRTKSPFGKKNTQAHTFAHSLTIEVIKRFGANGDQQWNSIGNIQPILKNAKKLPTNVKFV